MKTITFLKITLIALIISSCCSNDNGTPINDTLSGKYHLIQVSGTIAGINHLFEPGTISWEFNNNTLKVINNNTNEGLQDLFETGTYTISIEQNSSTAEVCPETINIDAVNYGCFSLENNTLIISQIESDGYLIKLKRF